MITRNSWWFFICLFVWFVGSLFQILLSFIETENKKFNFSFETCFSCSITKQERKKEDPPLLLTATDMYSVCVFWSIHHDPFIFSFGVDFPSWMDGCFFSSFSSFSNWELKFFPVRFFNCVWFWFEKKFKKKIRA